jgi:3-oxoadipate enol-lactonase
LEALITTLDLDKPAICGISLGGMLALVYASEYPDTISALGTLGAETPETLTYGEGLRNRFRRSSMHCPRLLIATA